MTICHTPDCPASSPSDEYGRPVSVQHGSVTQPVLGAAGHHLLNRQQEGTLRLHLQSWNADTRQRAADDVQAERDRVRRYLTALDEVARELQRDHADEALRHERVIAATIRAVENGYPA